MIIADLQSHLLGGHFRIWLNRTLAEALKHFDKVTVYIADEISAPDLSKLPPTDQSRITILQIPEIKRNKKFVGDILGVISRHHATLNPEASASPIFLMWAQQYLERDLIFPPIKSWLPFKKNHPFISPWATMTSVSSVSHDRGAAPEMELRINEMIRAEENCIGALLWDEYAVQSLGGKYFYLPDVEPCEADPEWRLPDLNSLTIGCVGQLWGGRSVNLLSEILDSEKGMKGYLGGVLKPNSYTDRAKTLLQRKEIITVEEGFVERDDELNGRLCRLDAFVIDSRAYKCPSGLAIRAMAMGRPIVTVESPSWIANLIKEYGVGVFWNEGKANLESNLREWSNSGGSDRSIAAARKLNDHEGMERAFEEIFNRLKEASVS